jgi:hypothetical protein
MVSVAFQTLSPCKIIQYQWGKIQIKTKQKEALNKYFQSLLESGEKKIYMESYIKGNKSTGGGKTRK